MESPSNNVAVDMSSKTLNAEGNPTKKRKTEADDVDDNNATPNRKSFEGFRVRNVLKEDLVSKTIFIEGDFESAEGKAVLILEKMPFGKNSIQQLLTHETTLVNNFNNNIYGSYKGYPRADLNGIQATIIHPATEKHVQKYLYQPSYVIKETPEMHQDVVLPEVKKQFSLEWVYNILEHKSEVERIVFEDPDPETGFVLLPDMKWSGQDVSNLYLVAIAHKRGIRSLRDLTSEHLPLLENIRDKATEAISDKYSLPKCKLRAYLHYLPSYHHLHVHFTNIEFDAPGTQPERAHLLNNVINNINIRSDYYQAATLTYCLKENDPLYEKLKSNGYFK